MSVRIQKRAGGESSADNTSKGTANHSIDTSRAEALLRTVTGIADARIVPHPAGGIAVVRINCTDEDVSPGQVVRNVRSALFAGCGIAVSAECVDFVSASELATTVLPASHKNSDVLIKESTDDVPPSGAASAPRSPRTMQTSPLKPAVPDLAAFTPRATPSAPAAVVRGIQIAKPHADSTAPAASFENAQPTVATVVQQTRLPRILNIVSEDHVEEPAGAAAPALAPASATVGNSVRDIVASAAALRLESVEMRRQSGRLRCRVVISLGKDHFGAVADSADPNAGEIHLAGRVACDALRAGGFTDARFDGAAVAHINGRQHVVVALSEWMGGETMVLSGAAPLEELPERAAAIAAIKAVLAQDIN